MRLLFVCLLSVLAVVSFVTETKGSSQFDSECLAWKNVTDHVKRVDPLNVTCTPNPLCTGFDCSGLLNILTLHENVRFGGSFIPCSEPIEFEVVINIGDYPFNQSLSIDKNQVINRTIPVPGLTRKINGIACKGNVTIILISSVSANGKQVITTQISVAVELVTWTRNYVVVPNVTVPLPSCFITPPPSVMSKQSALTQNSTVGLTGKTCSPNSLETPCEEKNVICKEDGRCACLPEFSWSKHAGQCVNSSKSAVTDPWIIVGAVISVIVVLAGILIIIVNKYRRRRERYGQHTLLINNDNDTELDDPDPPMLTG